MTSVGGIRGSIRISATQALAAYASVRRANASTKAALLGASSAFMRVGTAALLAAAPIALLFKKAITSAADFQKKIDYFGAVTNASVADMDAVAKKAIEMSRTTVYSASDMADAFVEFGKAGISTRDILNGVADATANLAQAADISMGEAANIMASQMATFQIGADGAAHIADQIAGAANASIIDVQDLAYSLKYAGGIAATTGVSFDSLVTAISLLGQRGIKGSTAGTSLRQILVSLAGPTSKALGLMQDLGIATKDGANKFIDAAGHMKPLSQIFQILQHAERGYTDAQQLAINKTLFNSRALAAVQILMRDGAKGFANMGAQINKVTASDVAHKRLDNLAGDARHLSNAWNTLMIQVGGPLQNMFRMIVQGLTHLVEWFSHLSPTVQKFIIYGLGVVGVFLAITGILGLSIGLIIRVIAVWRDLFMAFRLIRGVIMPVITAFRALGMALLTNPIFLVIAAVVLLVAAFWYCWTHFKGFRDFFKKAWADIKGFFISAWHIINQVFRDIVGAAEAVGRWFMRDLVSPIKTAIRDVIGAFEAAYRFITRIFNDILGYVRIHWKLLLAVFTLGLGLIVDAVVTHWTWIKNLIVTVSTAIWHFIQGVWNVIYTIISTVVKAIVTAVTTYFNICMTIIRGVWTGISFFFRTLWNVIRTIFMSALHFIEALLRRTWSIIGGPLKAAWHGIAVFFSTIWQAIVKIFEGAVHVIGSILSSIGGFIGNAATAIWNGIQSIAGRVYDAVSGIVKDVYGILDSLISGMFNVGKNIIIGLWNGIAALSGWLWDKVSSFVSSLWKNLLGFFGIHSPSKKAQDEVGANIVRGIVVGLNQNTPAGVRAAIRMASAIHNAMKSGSDETVRYVAASMVLLGKQVATNLKNAQDKLRAAQQKFAQERSTVANGIMQGAGFSSLGNTGTDAAGNPMGSTLTGIMAQYRAAAAKARLFAAQLAHLKAEGLDPRLIQELANAGVDQSGAEVSTLSGASRSQIAAINATHQSIIRAAQAAGTTSAQAMYGAGIQVAQGLVRGIESQRAALLRVAAAMGDQIVAEVRRALGIHSPSRRMDNEVAADTVGGLVRGLIRRKSLVANAVKSLGDTMVGAHRGVLNTQVNMSMGKLLDNKLASRQYASLRNGQGTGSYTGVHVEKLEVNNPRPEPASNSLALSIRKVSYMHSGPSR